MPVERLPQPASRAHALLRTRALAPLYPEGAAVGEADRLSSQALAVLLEAVELVRELRAETTGRPVMSNPHLAISEVIGRHLREEEIAGIFLLDDLNCLLAEEIFAPCLPMAYHKKGRLSVESAAAKVLSAAEMHGATGFILFHLARHGYSSAGESHKLIPHLRRAAEPRGLRFLDYLAISPPLFESLRGGPSWGRP